jgi:hypothetical protein
MFKFLFFFLFPFYCFSQALVHPGLSHKKSDLDRMKLMVLSGKDPWKKSFESLKENPYASYNYTVRGNLSYTSLDATNADANPSSAPYDTFKFDGLAAYYNALMWSITGDIRHANKAVEIFKAWVNIRGINSGGTKALDAGRVIWKMLEGAEIIKNTYSGWSTADITAFKDMLVYPGYSTSVIPQSAIDSENATFYWYMYNGDPGRYGNQGLFAWKGIMAMGIFMDNRIMYDRALRYLTAQAHRSDDLPYQSGPAIASNSPNPSTASNPSNAYYNEYNQIAPYYSSTTIDYGFDDQLQHYFYENGQTQESARDQGHALLGVSLVLSISEIAWNQGDDIYSYNSNSLLKALEYALRYNASLEYQFPDQMTPWEPTIASGEFIKRRSRSGRWESLKINPWNANDLTRLTRGASFKGDNSPLYELALSHFKDRLGLSEDQYKWTKRVHEISIQESGFEQQGFDVDHPGFGGLTFRRPNLCYGDPVGTNNGIPILQMNTIPGTIEAENFDYLKGAGEGKTFHDISTSNTGNQYRTTESVDIESCSDTGAGYNIKDVEPGEWLNYTVSVPSTGYYTIKIRYAAINANGKIRFEFDGTDKTAEVSVPFGASNSSGPQDWKDFIVANGIVLNKGVQSMRIFISGSAVAFKLNSITIENATTIPTLPPPTGLSASIGSKYVKIKWNESVGATSYIVKRASVSGGSYTVLATNVTDLYYIDTNNLLNGNSYFYVVAASNSGSVSLNSNEIAAIPIDNKILIEDNFLSGIGLKITGRTPDFSNFPSRSYEITKTTSENTTLTNLVTGKGAKLSGPTTGEVFNITSIGTYSKPSLMTISAKFNMGDITTEVPSRTGRGFFIGFWSSISTSSSVNIYPFANMRGFMINPDTGKILLWDGSSNVTQDFTTTPERIQNYNGTWIGGLQNHSISYTVNTVTGKIVDFYLDGVRYSWDQNFTGFSLSNTNYAGFGISTSTASTSSYISSFALKEAGLVTTWNGFAWSDGVPNDAKEAIIAGIYDSLLNGEFVAKKVTVNSGGILNIRSGTSISIQNELVNNGTASSIVIESGARLIQINSNTNNTGVITIKRQSTPMIRLDYTLWSSPVASQNLFNFSPSTIPSRFYKYDTLTNSYVTNGISNVSNFEIAKGYAVRAPNNFSATPTVFIGEFVGVPNNGNQTISLNSSSFGFNLVGNPYPSPIDANKFVDANNTLIDGTLYFYTHNIKSNGTAYESAAMQYATWNKTGSVTAPSGIGSSTQNNSTPNGTIQVGQGFIVKALNPGNLSFTNDMRTITGTVLDSNQFFKTVTVKRSADPEKHRIWLDLTNANGEGLSQLLVGYVDGATNEVDNLYDGEEFGNPTTSLSSRLNDKNYIIQGRALPFVDSDAVALDFKAGIDGEYTISLAKTDGVFASSQEVYLKDNLTGILHDLKQSSYTFSASTAVVNNRFEIIYSKANLSSISLVKYSGVIAFKKDGVFQLNSAELIKEIAAYDLQGRQLFQQDNINANVASLPALPSNRGVLVLKVVSIKDEIVTLKVVN